MTAASSSREQWLERYRDQIGRARSEVTTPALILDLDKAKRNIATMAEKFRELPAELRPHIKVHKSRGAGAAPSRGGRRWRRVRHCLGGHRDGPRRDRGHPDREPTRAARQGGRRRGACARPADHGRGGRRRATSSSFRAAAGQAGSQLELLIEIDVGMGRCGVRTKDGGTATRRADRRAPERPIARAAGLRGPLHARAGPRHALRGSRGEREARRGRRLSRGKRTPCADLSAGGTGTYFITGANPRITEVQAGSYTLMDCFHGNLVPGGFEVAMTVAGTVVSPTGEHRQCSTSDASRSVSTSSRRRSSGFPRAQCAITPRNTASSTSRGRRRSTSGTTAEVMAGYGPTTVNLHDVFHVVERDVVTDIWPVSPRGPGPPQ